MEGNTLRQESCEWLHTRAHSQPGNMMLGSLTTSRSTSAASSHPRTSTPSLASYTHRQRLSYCDPDTPSVSHLLRLPLEQSREPMLPMTPISSLLQEKLQQERRAESERLSGYLGDDLASSTAVNIRGASAQGSTHRRIRSVVERSSTSSYGDDSSQSSMGAKQMEQAVSTLHKQNFDLKLELFHRREKQSSLEARVEELEAERLEWQATRDTLLDEMITRDKAIAEAVNMIVKLEASVDKLVEERELFRQAVADGSLRDAWHAVSDSLHSGNTKKKQSDRGLLSVEANYNNLERMPSFLTERSAHTENLRSVVLQNCSGSLHARKISQFSNSSADASEINRVASPSLSILSESSFVSIYGPKQGQDELRLQLPENVSGMNDASIDRSATPTKRNFVSSLADEDTLISSRRSSMTPRAAVSHSGQETPLADSAHAFLRPSSKTSRRDEPMNAIEESFESSLNSWERGILSPAPQTSIVSPLKRNKSRTLNTRSRDNSQLGSIQVFPPSPDTVTSSILQKHKDSSTIQDSLIRHSDAQMHVYRPESSLSRQGYSSVPTTASKYDSESPDVDLPSVEGNPPPSDLPPQSSRSTEKAAANPWPGSDSYVSDSDSDGGADATSDTESFDYWMYESFKPEHSSGHSSTQLQPVPERALSPDLFSFPADSGAWEPDAMYGAINDDGFLGQPIEALKRDPMDEMASPVSSTQQQGSFRPADVFRLPSRKSSLNPQNPQTASEPVLLPQTGGTWGGPSREGGDLKAETRNRSHSVDEFGRMLPAGGQPRGLLTKRSHYPPISSLSSKGRGFGLSSFLRRSGSDAHARSATPDPNSLHRASPAPQTPAQQVKRHSAVDTIPSSASMPWAVRPAPLAEDESARATPPPIQRTRAPRIQTDIPNAIPMVQPSEVGQVVGAGERSATPAAAMGNPGSVSESAAARPQSGGGMRRWLGLGKRSSIMNRTK